MTRRWAPKVWVAFLELGSAIPVSESRDRFKVSVGKRWRRCTFVGRSLIGRRIVVLDGFPETLPRDEPILRLAPERVDA